MNSMSLYKSFCVIDEDILERSENAVGRNFRPVWLKWCAAAACICLVILAAVIWKTPPNSISTLPGWDKIYPTVMVQGEFYEWRKGAAICSELPDDCVYYGEVIHVDGETPGGDREFVSLFPVNGQIYTVPQTDAVVYLCITTPWMENTIVVFDFAKGE